MLHTLYTVKFNNDNGQISLTINFQTSILLNIKNLFALHTCAHETKSHTSLVTATVLLQILTNLLNFVHDDLMIPRGIRDWLDATAFASISASQRIFLARNCREWCTT